MGTHQKHHEVLLMSTHNLCFCRERNKKKYQCCSVGKKCLIWNYVTIILWHSWFIVFMFLTSWNWKRKKEINNLKLNASSSSAGITNAGSQVFIQANSEEDMLTWIDSLNESCKITVIVLLHSACYKLMLLLKPVNYLVILFANKG